MTPEHAMTEDNLVDGGSASCYSVGKMATPLTSPVVGAVFGSLTLVVREPNRKTASGGTRRVWSCRCACGVLKSIREDALKNGDAKSCGCRALSALVKDLRGQRFGRLTVVAQMPSGKARGARWKVRCDCGVEKTVLATNLNARGMKSCGCFKPHRTHGHTARVGGVRVSSPTHIVWSGIIQRCTNPNVEQYRYYGGRGITVAERWRGVHGFESFLADIGERPEGMWIDRIDPNGNYEPGNVRWATPLDQQRNKRLSRERLDSVLKQFESRDPALIDEIRRALFGAS